MKRLKEHIGWLVLLVIVVFAGGVYAKDALPPGGLGFWKKNTDGSISPRNGESVAIPDPRLGVSPFQINGNTTLTAAQCDGRLYYIPEGTPPVIKLPAPALGLAAGFENATGASGSGTGATWWATGSPTIFGGEGTSAISGITLFANAGVTRQVLWTWVDIVGGTLAWKASTNMTLSKLP